MQPIVIILNRRDTKHPTLQKTLLASDNIYGACHMVNAQEIHIKYLSK